MPPRRDGAPALSANDTSTYERDRCGTMTQTVIQLAVQIDSVSMNLLNNGGSNEALGNQYRQRDHRRRRVHLPASRPAQS